MKMRYYNANSDFGEVYRIFTSEELNHLIICRPYHNDTISFQKWLNSSLVDQINDFMVFTDNDTFLGFAYSYEFHPLEGHTRMTVAVKKEYILSGVGCMIATKFLEYLFKTYSLRKVYMHVYDYNNNSINLLQKIGLTEEAKLKEYHYYNNKYYDMIIYSITRKENELLLVKYMKKGGE